MQESLYNTFITRLSATLDCLHSSLDLVASCLYFYFRTNLFQDTNQFAQLDSWLEPVNNTWEAEGLFFAVLTTYHSGRSSREKQNTAFLF